MNNILPHSNTSYHKSITSAGFHRQKNAGFLRLSGEDRVAFLQRQTTNDIKLLSKDDALLTVLTSPTARILDVFYLLQEDNGIDLITLPGNAETTFRFLKNRIFFMDKVELENESERFYQIDIFGSKATEILQLGFSLSLSNPGKVISLSVNDLQGWLFKMHPISGLGYRTVITVDTFPLLLSQLVSLGITEVDELTFKILKIEAGIPDSGTELIEAYTPLETNLGMAISANKGCYTGQEIIARQITYEKITQRLCGIRLQRQPTLNSRLWDGEKPVGEITSFGASPRFGWIALAMVRIPFAKPGMNLEAENEDGERFAVEIVPIPFSD